MTREERAAERQHWHPRPNGEDQLSRDLDPPEMPEGAPKGWDHDALCNDPAGYGMVADSWPDPASREEARDAMEVCEDCPVRALCAARRRRGDAGVWGGRLYV